MASDTSIEHIVLYSFEDESILPEATDFIKSLQTKAQKDGKPYVLSIKCGSTRPLAPVRSLGFNLASTVTFRSDADREYFVKEDPAHQELIKFVTGKLAKGILVLDFADGEAAAVSKDSC